MTKVTFNIPERPLLAVELIPKTCWGKNARARLTEKDWDLVRRAVYRDAGYSCQACGAQEKLDCHEVFEYVEGTQRLADLVALCGKCHSAKHICNAAHVIEFLRRLKHLGEVNGWSLVECCDHVIESYEEYTKRSRELWKLNLSFLTRYGVENV